MDSTSEEKQSYIKTHIIDKGFDLTKFHEYITIYKSNNPNLSYANNDVYSWTMGDIEKVVSSFISSQQEEQQQQQQASASQKISQSQIILKPAHSSSFQGETPLPLSASNDDFNLPPASLSKKKGININIKNVGKNFIKGFLGLKKDKGGNSNKKNVINENNNNQNLNQEEKKEEEENTPKFDYGLGLPEKIKCENIVQNDIGKQGNDIQVQIGFPEKTEKSIFTKKSTTFKIQVDPLGFQVKRTFVDFEWLRETLVKNFDANFIPSLPKIISINSHEDEDQCIRHLKKFVNFLLMDPIIKNSAILYDFLSVEREEFLKKRKEYENPTPCADISNFKTQDGEVNINYDKNTEKKMYEIKEYASINSILLNKLNKSLKNLYQEMKTVINRLDEISATWSKLFQASEKYNDDTISRETYFQMNNLFYNLGETFKKENEFFNLDIKEHFIFMENNFVSIQELIKRVEKEKKFILKEEKDLIALKEDLYNSTHRVYLNQNSESENGINNNNLNSENNNKEKLKKKNEDLAKLLPKNTEALLDMKKMYGFYLNRFLSEYQRMKSLNANVYREKFIQCYKTQNQIVTDLCVCVQNIITCMDACANNNQNVIIDPMKKPVAPGNEFSQSQNKDNNA